MPKITIDGREIEVEKNINIIEAAKKLDIEIPHYCYHPALKIDGNCRMCLVEMKTPKGLVPTIACNTFPSDGMEIITNSENVKNMRKSVMEFLLHNHPIDCPICDQAGECKLQDYYMNYGKYNNRSIVEKVHKGKVLDIGEFVVLDQERCILCSWCVRFCADVTKTNELMITNRGVHSQIEVFPSTKLENKYSANVVDICPVGALTNKDFRFKMRVWFMDTGKSICQGCSRGCNIIVDHKDSIVYRFRPKHNPEVNNYWMCDEGRMTYKNINSENRLLNASYENTSIEFDEAIDKFAEIIEETKEKFGLESIASIASPYSTLEDNFVLKTFMKKVIGSDKVYGLSLKPDGFEDEFLIKADKTPNKKSFEFLDINQNKEELLKQIENKKIKLLIIMNNDIIVDSLDEFKVDTIISLSTHKTKTIDVSKLSLPVSIYVEKYGSVINFNGQIQKLEKCFDSFEFEENPALSEWEVFVKLSKKLSKDLKYNDIEDIWKDLSNNTSFYNISDYGLNLNNI